MSHLVLLGDATFDNGAYTAGGPAVISQVRKRIPVGWRATLVAVDGATIADIGAQLARLPADAERLFLSVGGNDLLQQADILGAPVTTSAEAFDLLGAAARRFEAAYRDMLRPCLQIDRHMAICTVYSGNFPEPTLQRLAEIALAPFNDAIIRIGVEHGLTILDLRLICSAPADYANPIEPSAIGGGKIAEAIVSAAKNDKTRLRSARIIG
ncbi:SGNH/GDSL hydrolase family protein [Methylocystis sp. MJC1]|jgi:hypothetical protein|uniref:SGNH/GDSL hydrolase family protein n=1 Tax=Methylocystis sp. MJC1 TaxID=2654282 RepID=UPI0013ED47D9|nr:SGNH/GDSL hydrolase family protein [Methylocystis sp. MJC1]KAF2992179.1 hypothetical protein MJC1_00554 [Methylocystis sp. MJC1]MBU6527319.1 SGNH/GDSL hydrolase family protein [Methylocystis sp. MJC1]UZX10270.1 SGNH/GDSL hydrolase family protein [Methylocystis sp. MJC1]